MARDTVGKIASQLKVHAVDNTHSAHEQMLEQLGEYDYNLYTTCEAGKKFYPKNFFIVVTTKKERLMDNVIRNYFYHRWTCPTPTWDQTVYRYNRADDCLEFIWVIPSQYACEYLRANALTVLHEERDLLNFVMNFFDGTLDRLADTLDKENNVIRNEIRS